MLLEKDFPDLKKFKPKYKRAHVFMNATCSAECMGVLAKNRDVVNRISSFTELHLDFFARDACIFHLNKGPLQMFRTFPSKKDTYCREYA